jgi:Rrf2 family protein
MALLAYRPDHMATSDMIAQNVCTHPARVRKVMSCLRKQGYIDTKEGSGGGYILNCEPSKVTLAELYRATALGAIKPTWCSGDQEQDCMVACHMAQVMGDIFCDAERHLLNYLQQVTIAGVLEQLREAQRSKD